MKWFIIVATLVVSVILFFLYVQRPVLVYIYDDKFVPQTLEINPGDSVLFISKASREVWPASDSHPTHNLYPEFDTQRPLAPGEKWKFTFTKPGTWEFHDHLLSQMSGKIFVKGEGDFSDAARVCVANTSGINRAACWQKDFEKLIDSEGLNAGLNKFVEFYEHEPNFKDYCHDIMHYVGRASYTVFALDKSIISRPELSYCGFGFYHGFIEASLEATGSAGLETAKAYCEAVLVGDSPLKENESNTAGACWHGIGHSIFDSLPGILWGDPVKMTLSALNTCEEIFENAHRRRQCATGVFNSLANALISNNYKLTFNPDEMVNICNQLKLVYQDACYLDLAVVYSNSKNLNLKDSIDYALTFPEVSNRSHSIIGIVDDILRRGTPDVPSVPEVVKACEGLDLPEYQKDCLIGLITGIAFSSHIDNIASRLQDSCTHFTDPDLKVLCEDRVIKYLVK
jgi:plastocyanin